MISIGTGARALLGWRSVLGDPGTHILTQPHLAHGKDVERVRKVAAPYDLLYALAAYPAEHQADLSGSDQVTFCHDRKHRLKTTGHLTSRAMRGKTSHMTTPGDEKGATP